MKSPCLRMCRHHEIDDQENMVKRQLCASCYRTMDEISRWSKMTEAEQKSVWWRLRLRTPYLFDKYIVYPVAGFVAMIIFAWIMICPLKGPRRKRD